jgi:histidinol-phosphatase
MLDPVMNLWDVAALKPCVEGAGGRLTDFAGDGTKLGTSALSTNGALHGEVLEILRKKR